MKRILFASFILAACASAPAAEEISLQAAPPVVVKTVPVAGSVDVDPALAEIRVTYSKPMQDGSWSWSTWGEESFPEGAGQAHYLADNRTCVMPVKLQPGKFYAIWLNSSKFRNFKDADGRPAVPYLLAFRTSAAGQPGAAGASSDSGQRLKSLVEDFFAHNFRDVTSRETLEWGEVIATGKGDSSIRYKYRAKIRDKETVTNNQVFTFDPQGKFVSVTGVYASPKERMMALVEKFFGNNFRDVTSRETLEWGDVTPDGNGNSSIRCKYRAKIWNKETVTNDQVFTFDPQDKFVSVKDLGPTPGGARPAR